MIINLEKTVENARELDLTSQIILKSQLNAIDQAEPYTYGDTSILRGEGVFLPQAFEYEQDYADADTDGFCVQASLYNVLNSVGENVTFSDVIKHTPKVLREGVYSVEDAILIKEMLGLSRTGVDALSAYLHHKQKVPGGGSDKIEQMVRYLQRGKGLVLDIQNTESYYPMPGINRHALAIVGFELDERGVPIFYVCDGMVKSSSPIPVEARHLAQYSEDEYVVIG